MEQYIKKSEIVAEIERRIKECDKLGDAAADNNLSNTLQANELLIRQYISLLYFLDTLEVKEVDLEEESLTWKDIGTIDQLLWDLSGEHSGKSDNEGYYKAFLSRFKSQKGE